MIPSHLLLLSETKVLIVFNDMPEILVVSALDMCRARYRYEGCKAYLYKWDLKYNKDKEGIFENNGVSRARNVLLRL